MSTQSERFTVTPLFAEFLETVEVEWNSDAESLVLVCQECSEVLCWVEEDDTLGVLVRTALAHDTHEHEHQKAGV